MIDRNLLLSEIEKSREKNPHKDSKIRANHTIEHDHIARLVLEQPTAYVVEQLEENAKCFQCEADGLAQVGNWGTATELQGKAAAYRDAAKTVKSCGIE